MNRIRKGDEVAVSFRDKATGAVLSIKEGFVTAVRCGGGYYVSFKDGTKQLIVGETVRKVDRSF